MTSDALEATQVFTPPGVTNQMLDLLAPSCFGDESTYFFEPSCGDGQMLEVILDRMFQSFSSKYEGDKEKAMAETLTRFYAVELDPALVVAARTRVFQWCLAQMGDVSPFGQYLIARTLQNSIEHKDFHAALGLNPVARKLSGGKRK